MEIFTIATCSKIVASFVRNANKFEQAHNGFLYTVDTSELHCLNNFTLSCCAQSTNEKNTYQAHTQKNNNKKKNNYQ